MQDRNDNETELLFAGEFVHAIDPQRRIAIPKDWRNKDGMNRFYIVPGRHKTLQLMTYASFKRLAEKLRKVSIADPKASVALARLGARSRECKCDKNGRIPIAEHLLEYAEIKTENNVDAELVLVGAFNSIQIWSKKNWEKQFMADEEMLDVLQGIEELRDEI